MSARRSRLDDISRFRSIVMAASYLAEDRPDILDATKEAARFMSEPTTVAWERLERIGRFLVRVPRLVQRLERQRPCSFLLAYSDSDHAGCLRARRSTPCAMLFHGRHFLNMMCAAQVPAALSSGASEWYALTHAASAILGMKHLARDL